MKLCEGLYDRIKNMIKIYNNTYEDIQFDVKHSNTTNSIYLLAISNDNGITIKKKYRLSDHKNSRIKTKIIAKSTKFSYIERLFESMARDVRMSRFKMLMNQINQNNLN